MVRIRRVMFDVEISPEDQATITKAIVRGFIPLERRLSDTMLCVVSVDVGLYTIAGNPIGPYGAGQLESRPEHAQATALSLRQELTRYIEDCQTFLNGFHAGKTAE